MQGWMGRRLCVDLGLQRSWVEEIPEEDLEQFVGGRGLNGKFFIDFMSKLSVISPPETPIALSVGPLTGTVAPCSGWASISTFSSLFTSLRYVHTSLPGHWGPQLKFAGFDQLVIYGRAEAPLYVVIDGEKVRFEAAKPFWGRNAIETTVLLQEAEKDRNAEVLCIGPAGENLIAFANVTNRCSWTADHVGMGAIFGLRNLKALVVRGNRPVHLHQHELFLQRCLSLRERIRRDQNTNLLREEGPFFFLGEKGGTLGIKNYGENSQGALEEQWRTEYLNQYLFGREGCFSCPIHCGRISEVNGNYFGGVHFESAWSLGPRIGITDWGKTFKLLRSCQLLGLDPSSVGSLVSWVMDCYGKGVLSSRELGIDSCEWGDDQVALRLIELIIHGKGTGEIFRQGAFQAARMLGKGLELVPHFWGMDLPARDPRSSAEFALSRALFPMEWDYLQSFAGPFQSIEPAESEQNGLIKKILAAEKLRILADIHALCPLATVRLPLISVTDIEEMGYAATGSSENTEGVVHRVMQIEKTLINKNSREEMNPYPDRFFDDPLEKNIEAYHRFIESD
jgi:aldehyde:ferredoxin oxidoreductase